MDRIASITRTTTETDISVTLNLDGTGKADIATGIGFLDHMLTALARHGLFDLTVRAKGDLHIDFHHTTEDVGIVLGQAFAKAIGDKRGIRRFGHALVPMDEALAEAAVDISGRPFLVLNADFGARKSARWTPNCSRNFFVPWRSTPWSRCISPRAPATTPTMSRRPASRPPLERCAWRRSSIRARRRDPLHQGGAMRIWTAPISGRRRAHSGARGFLVRRPVFGPIWLAAHRAWIPAGSGLACVCRGDDPPPPPVAGVLIPRPGGVARTVRP